MRLGVIHHANGIRIAPVPLPAGRAASGVSLLEAGIGKQVGPALDRLDHHFLELDRRRG